MTEDWETERQEYLELTLPSLEVIPPGHTIHVEAIELPVRVNKNEVLYPGELATFVAEAEEGEDFVFRYWKRL